MGRRVAVLAGVLALLAAMTPASAKVLSVVRVSAKSPFPIGDCRPLDTPVFPAAPGSEGSPTLAVNPRDPRNMVVAYSVDLYGVVVAASFDRGKTWQHTVVDGVTRCTGGTLDHGGPGGLAFGPDGTLYLAVDSIMSGFPSPGAFVSSVGVVTSADGGRTWSSPVWIDDVPVGNRVHQISAEPDQPGGVVVTWHSPQPAATSYLSRSTDEGRTWTTSTLPNPAPQFQPFLTPLAVSDGTLYVFLANQRVPTVVKHANEAADHPLDLSSEVFVTRSDDKGTTWGQPSAVVGGVIAQWVGAEEASDGTIYVSAWRRLDTARRELIVVRSTDGARTWSRPSIVARDVVGAFPQLDLTEQGTLGLTYLRPAGEELQAVFGRSIDGGRTWAFEPVAGPFPAPVFSEYTRLQTAADGPGFVSVFIRGGSDNDGPTDVYAARVR